MFAIGVPRHRSISFHPTTTRQYQNLTRCVKVLFKPENRTRGRKFRLLGLADTYGPVHNLFGDPEGDSFAVESFDVDAAQRFRKDFECLSTVEVDFAHGFTGRSPNESTMARIWRGISRTLLFVPEPDKSGKYTPEIVKATLRSMARGFEVANVRDRQTSYKITFYTLVDALTAMTICKNKKRLSGSLRFLPFNDYSDQLEPGTSQSLESQSVRRSLVISDLLLTEKIGPALCAMTAGCLLERSRYDSENRTMTLTFTSEQHMENCYNRTKSHNRPSPINPDTVSKAPFLNRKLPYNKQLAIALGVSSLLYLELPRNILQVGMSENGVNREAVIQTIRRDFAAYGVIGNINLHTDKRVAYVEFLDISAAVNAFWPLHLAIRKKGPGPLGKYKEHLLHHHSFVIRQKELATYLNRNLRPNLITD
ncbi:hypothetical protein V5O48_007402 [Marasmius crinis-equi]|uniref:RRM domain-containing protein n=1 Tax=Marasmius crinis-equi TaxID=585013 RepID=A0ABR3FHK0_9AGAR